MCPARKRGYLNKASRKGRPGFTLVELLVVLAIIAALAALLMPMLGKITENGREAKCSANLRQLGAAMAAYAAENDGEIIPGVKALTFDWYPTPLPFFWSDLLAPYVGLDIFSNGTSGTRPNGIFACPSSKELCHGGGRSDYAPNFYVNGEITENKPALRMASLPHPSKTLALADAIEGTPGETLLVRSLAPWINQNWGLAARHGSGTQETGRFNALFYDGHVESLVLSETPLGANAEQKHPWNPMATE